MLAEGSKDKSTHPTWMVFAESLPSRRALQKQHHHPMRPMCSTPLTPNAQEKVLGAYRRRGWCSRSQAKVAVEGYYNRYRERSCSAKKVPQIKNDSFYET